MAITWQQALRDPHVPIHWLVEIAGVGSPLRLADVNLQIDGSAFIGAVDMRQPPGVSIDPYTASPSVPNCMLTIRPAYYGDPGAVSPVRLYDLEAEWRTNFATLTADIYRWAENTALTERQLVMSGYIHNLNLDERGDWTLTIADHLLKYDKKFPRYFTNTKTFGNTRANDRGMGYPILYGTFTRMPSPFIDNSNATYHYSLAADGTIASITGAWLDDAATSTESLSASTDGLGRTVTRVRFTVATDHPVDQAITISGTGCSDNASGDYSGTASALITNPADQLHHMARTYAGVPASYVDAASFVAMRGELSQLSTGMQVYPNDSTSFFTIKDDLCSLIRSAVYPERGRLTARHLLFDRPAALRLVDGENVLGLQSIGWGNKRELITSLVIKYGWRYLVQKKAEGFAESLHLDDSDEAGFATNKVLLRGLADSDIDQRRLIETRSVHDGTTAEACGALLAELHGKPRKDVKLTANRDAHELRLYDTVEVTLPNAPGYWTDKLFVVTGITYGTETDDLTLMEC